MVSVLISFFYIGMTSFLLGFGIKLGAAAFFKYEMKEVCGILVAGLAGATVYAGYFSLFGKVGLAANLGLLALCGAVAVMGRKELLSFLREKSRELRKSKVFFLVLLVLIMAYGASRGYMHFDTGLYHAQSIRWIEEYGVVPGLANLHSRLAYNSSAFGLTALYSHAFLTGRSLHTVSGFLALVTAVKGFTVVQFFSRKRVMPSDLVKVALLWYISIIYTEMMSPSSDYFAMLFLFYVVLAWVELEERGEKEIVSYSLLCVLLVVILTVKLSAAIMLLLVLKPAVILLKEKRWGQIGGCLLLGAAAVFPYLARNVILSGWLVYPFGGLDLFRVDWKLPLGEVQYDAEEIKVYAKGMRDVLLKGTPIGEWFPQWFAALKGLEKIWVFTSIISLAAGGIWGFAMFIRRKKEAWGMVFLEGTLMAGYLFWQLGTPLVRYGYLYILAFPFFTAGLWFTTLVKKQRMAFRIIAAALVFLGVYKGINLIQDMLRYREQGNLVWQQDYVTGAYDSYEVDGVTIYVPLESGQIGYEKFPSSPYVREDIELRDGTLSGGFRRK